MPRLLPRPLTFLLALLPLLSGSSAAQSSHNQRRRNAPEPRAAQ